MPIDGSRKIVHLRCDDPSRPYKFIGVQACGTTCVIHPKNDHPDNVIHIGVPKIDEKTLRDHLAMTNHHEDDEVEIVVLAGVRNRGKEIPNASEYRSSRPNSEPEFLLDLESGPVPDWWSADPTD
ncbi:hypothetical protein KW807_01340 [Candidatus Parcubacteria bacterium]|nr:hypothetical protein [Candidatus Parcubacteria bacterium]